MARTWSITVVAASGMSRVPWYVLGGGALLLSLTWLYLMMSRRGATKPVSKCVLLSIWAHIILLGCAYLTHWFPVPVGLPSGTGEIRVQWITETLDGEDETASDGPLPLDANADQPDPADTEISPRAEPRMLTIEPDPVPDALPDLLPEPAGHDRPLIQDVVESPSRDSVATAADARAHSNQPVPEIQLAPPATSLAIPSEAVASNIVEANKNTSLPSTEDGDAEYVFSSTDAPRQAGPVAISHAAPETAEDSLLPPDLVSPRPTGAMLALAGVPERYLGRSADNRRRLAQAHGGSLDTEAAVEAALQWLAQAQDLQTGCWDNRRWEGGRETRELGSITQVVKADTAVTGLALLAFLGAGHTHREGPYQGNVRRGLDFLMRSQSPQTGSLAGDASRYVAMYCHGIATLAMSEALIMTGDPQIRPALIRAIDYTIRSQHPVTGGWRYRPGDLGDTSQFGWQLMALVSAQSAGISIPESTWNGAQRWLNRVTLGDAGGLACYTPDRPVASPSMTAEALFCRVFMPGAPRPATIDEAADFVARFGAQAEARNDLYFSYYATLALYQLQDHRWQRWNQTLTEHLLTSQRSRGELAGSWDPDTKWGPTGGRVYSTAMAGLCLETYYRYLPVYELAAARGRAIRQR